MITVDTLNPPPHFYFCKSYVAVYSLYLLNLYGDDPIGLNLIMSSRMNEIFKNGGLIRFGRVLTGKCNRFCAFAQYWTNYKLSVKESNKFRRVLYEDNFSKDCKGRIILNHLPVLTSINNLDEEQILLSITNSSMYEYVGAIIGVGTSKNVNQLYLPHVNELHQKNGDDFSISKFIQYMREYYCIDSDNWKDHPLVRWANDRGINLCVGADVALLPINGVFEFGAGHAPFSWMGPHHYVFLQYLMDRKSM